MEPLATVDVTDLLAPLHGELIDVLRSLDDAAWELPTLARQWRVRDVAAHLLDDDLRALSVLRDGHFVAPDVEIGGYGDLVAFLNRLNADWIRAAQRLSPRILIELLAATGPQAAAVMAALPPHEPSPFPVDWAGEERSENWLHVGREYTERWHHQMQIRDAVGAPELLERRWLAPLLELSVRALPHAYRHLEAAPGTAVTVTVTGAGGGVWSLVRAAANWQIWQGSAAAASTTVQLDPATAWRLLYNALSVDEARQRARVEGDPELAEPLFATRSVMV